MVPDAFILEACLPGYNNYFHNCINCCKLSYYITEYYSVPCFEDGHRIHFVAEAGDIGRFGLDRFGKPVVPIEAQGLVAA